MYTPCSQTRISGSRSLSVRWSGTPAYTTHPCVCGEGGEGYGRYGWWVVLVLVGGCTPSLEGGHVEETEVFVGGTGYGVGEFEVD